MKKLNIRLKKYKRINIILITILISLHINNTYQVKAENITIEKTESQNIQEQKEISEEIIASQSKTLGISDFLKEADKYAQKEFELDIGEVLNSAIKGKIDNSSIWQKILGLLFKDTIKAISSIASIIVIIIISSILKNISENLENKSIAQITHYVTYILIVTIIMQNFSDIIIMVKSSIENLVTFSNSLVPLLTTLIMTTGNITTASMLQPIILFIITFISNFINGILIPIVLISVALNIVSNISEKIQINKLSTFLNKSVIWILGIVLTLFVGVTSLEGSITNGVDALTVKTTKAAVSNFIPIVGKILRRCGRYSNEL